MLVFHSLEITKTPSSGCCLGGAVCAHQSWALLLGDTCPRCPVGLWLLACFTAKGEGLGDWIWSAWDGGHLHTEALVDTIIALVQTTSINTLPQRKQGLTPGLSVAGSPKTPGTKTMCSVDTPRWKPYKKQLMEVLHCRCLYANKEKTKYRSSPGRPGAVCPIPTCMASDEQPGRDATGAISLQCFLCTTTSWQSTLRYNTWAFRAGTTRLIFSLQSGPSEWNLLNAFQDEQRWIKHCVLSAAQSHRCFLVEILSGIPNVLPPHTKLVQSQCLWCCFVFVCSIACACQSCFLFWILDLWMESFQILGRSKVSCAQ